MYIVIFLVGLSLNTLHSYTVTNNDEVITIKKENKHGKEYKSQEEDWKWRYFPDKSNKSQYDPQTFYFARSDMTDVSPECDNGKKNLYLDWDESMVANYTCTEDLVIHDESVGPEIYGNLIPTEFIAPHYCMEVKINYTSSIVTYGGHRPLWARYGEYKFIPRQRWLYNAEHGALIMLYHPCANPKQVDQLRNLVKSCIYRHIITPYNLLPKEQPLALITWGWYLGMNVVRPKLVHRFIKEHALRAPKNIEIDGKYDYSLKEPAKIVSDQQDSDLCLGLSMM